MIYTEQSIIKVLAYFNIFSFPLTEEEIYHFLDQNCRKEEFDKTLSALIEARIIYRVGNFISVQDNLALSERRDKGALKANEQLKIADKIGRFLYRFPFVKGIAVSGSLSKNYADDKSDIDFFIVTKANRLWLARTLMHLFKKLTFLTGKEHWYCMNYYIDEQAYEIKEKNIFTAVEVMTVLPLYGSRIFKDFFKQNKWTKAFSPLYVPRTNNAKETTPGFVKSICEKILDNSIGDRLNKFFMGVTVRRWNKKAQKFERSYSGELMGLDANLHYAKPDPGNFQQKVLKRYEAELAAMTARLEAVYSS